MSTVKPSPGEWSYRKWSNCSDSNLQEGFSISAGGSLLPLSSYEGDIEEAEANAALIADAGTTFDRTGKTPSKLAESLAESRACLADSLVEITRLRSALEVAQDHIDMSSLEVSHVKDWALIREALK